MPASALSPQKKGGPPPQAPLSNRIRINGVMMEKTPLFLYDPRLFALLIGRRTSPLLSRLHSDIFDRILAHCGPFQRRAWAPWSDKQALSEWLALDTAPPLKNLSLLILGIKPQPARYHVHGPDAAAAATTTTTTSDRMAKPAIHPPCWKTTHTHKTLAFEVRCQDRLIAAGGLRWCNSLLFTTPADSTNTRAYVRLHLGKMGKRSTPRHPVRAHIGLVSPSDKRSKRTVVIDDDDGDGDEKTRFKYRLCDDCVLSLDAIPDAHDAWFTMLSMQALSLHIKWAADPSSSSE